MESMPVSKNKNPEVNQQVKMMLDFTGMYRQYDDEDIAIREAMCLKAQFPGLLCEIMDDDLFAGRLFLPAVSFTPQADGDEGGFGYVFSQSKINQLLNNPELLPENKIKLKELMSFWEKEHTSYKTRNAYPAELKRGLPSDNWTKESGIAFPLYRMAGTHLNYKKLVTLGIEGLKQEIKQYKDKQQQGTQIYNFYKASELALNTFCDICNFYADMALKMSAIKNKERKEELLAMENVLRSISTHKPQSFREAIQLSFLYCLVSGSQNYGRMDTYLADWYVHDVDHSIISENEALRLMVSLWNLMIARNAPYDGRVIIGGKNRENEKNADRFAMLAMGTAHVVKDILPQLTLRFYKGQNPELLRKAYQVLSGGTTFPMLYNDDVNIPSVQKAFDVPFQDAVDYLPYGCGEYMLYHKSVGTPSSVLNLLKALEVTLHHGFDPVGKKYSGIPSTEIKEFRTFDDLWNAYKNQVEYYIDLLAVQEEIEYRIAVESASFLYLSILYDDCLKQGKGIFSGGVRYLGGTMETYGNISTADSLTAIKKNIYDKKAVTIEQLVDMLDKNFAGFEKERLALLEAPKYGNDNEEADQMAQLVHEHVCRYTRGQRKKTNLQNYLVVVINNDANTTLGRYTAASADGRRAFTSMSNGNSPFMGMDKNGITAMLNSLVKLDTTIHAGAVQNMKFSKEMFSTYFDKLEALLNTYFLSGGAQAMLTVVGKDDLIRAIKHPEQYQNLIIRVGGFSARFVNLSPAVQEEILNRTLY